MLQNNFGEKEMLTDLLCTQKHISSSYNTALLESATPEVASSFHGILEEEHGLQEQIFNIMHNKGYYPTPKAEETKIYEAKQTYREKATAL